SERPRSSHAALHRAASFERTKQSGPKCRISRYVIKEHRQRSGPCQRSFAKPPELFPAWTCRRDCLVGITPPSSVLLEGPSPEPVACPRPATPPTRPCGLLPGLDR